MSYTVTHHKSSQKFFSYAIIVAFMMTIISSMPEVLAQGTYYVGGSGAADTNPGSSTQPFLTIQKAATVAPPGSFVNIRTGTYRETITPTNGGITFQPDEGAAVTISGLDQVTTSWTVHSANIYKTTIPEGLPVDNAAGYNLTISESNTTLFNNQVFKDNTMQFEARYPNVTTEADLLDFTKMRHYSQITDFNTTQIVDNAIPTSGLAGAKLAIHGWFWNHMRTVSSQPSQNTLNFSSAINNSDGLNKYRHYYYVCGKLVLLDAAKEWHYDPATNILYLWQTGGGSPTNISYKKRNWGFDLRGVDNVTIKGITFIGCEVAHGSTTTDGVTIDNVRATYTNHDVMYEDIFPGYGNATETGTQLLGINNTVKNSEFRYTAAHGIFVGTGGLITNNLYQDCGYDGSWGAPFSFAGSYVGNANMPQWGDADDVHITYNTVERTGRSAVDMSFSYTDEGVHDNLNIEVAYNDFSYWGMINVDLGAIYSWGFRNLTGSTIHHNYFHHDGIVADPSGVPLHGGQYAIYFDQASGPYTVHHNVVSDCWTGLPTNAGDTYNQPNFEHRNAGSTMYYNNTFASEGPYSHKVSVNSPKDIWRNNICNERLNANWNGAEPMNEQYNIFDGEVSNTPSVPTGTGTLENQDFTTNFYAATGAGVLYYTPHASSTSTIRNQGTPIAGITPAGDSNPDKGAREFGDTWVPGYVPVPFEQSVAVTGVTVSPASVTIGPGSASVQLTKTISPSNATNQNVTWSSNTPGVATVNSSGLVTGVAEGTATITVTTQDGSFTAPSAVTVVGTIIDNAVMGTGVNQHNYTGSGWVHAATQPTFLNSTFSFSNVTNDAMTISFVGSKIEWYTEKMNHHGIVAVSIDNGTETNVDLYAAVATQRQLVYTSPALTQGSHTFKIRATGTKNAASTGFYAIHDFVKVYSGVAVSGVTVSPTTSSLVIGSSATVQLTKTINPSNATNQNVTWTSDNTNVATVSSSGLVTAVSPGSATVTVTTEDGSFTATSDISVFTNSTTIDDAVMGTGVNQHNYTGSGWVHAATQPTFLNSTFSFSNVTNDAMTISFVGSKIEWYTEKMNHHGIVAVSIDNGTEVNVDLYAATAVQQVRVYNSPMLTQGSHTFKIRATGTKNAASTGYYAIHDYVKIYSSSIPVTGVTVSPTTSSLIIGGTVQLTKTISPSNATNQNVTWTSDNTSVATVNSSGLVTAVAAGNATITATTQDGSFTATSAITVYTSVTTIDDAVMGSGVNQHNYTGSGWVHAATQPTFLNSTFSFSNVTNNAMTISFVGSKIEWYTEKMNHHGIVAVSIDNGTEVNVDLYAAQAAQQLLVYTSPALTQGSHTFKIRATGTKNAASTGYYAIHDYVKIYSSSIPVTGVTVSPTTVALTIGGTATAQLTKTISPSNATNQNVTWSSDNASVATVNSSGLVTAAGAGNATITATTQDGSFTGTCAVTVSTTSIIDDAVMGTGVNQHNYTGSGWVHAATQPTFYNSTLSFSNVTNEAMTISFVGNKIEWYTEKMTHHGIVAVSIDNGTEVNVDLYAATAVQQQLVYTSPALTQGSHTFKIRATGTKNAASTGYYAIHDFVKIYSSASGGGGGEPMAAFQNKEITELRAYSNPVKLGDVLTLELPSVPGELKILDAVGRLNYSLPVTNSNLEIPTGNLATGVYLLHYKTSTGRYYVKIIVN